MQDGTPPSPEQHGPTIPDVPPAIPSVARPAGGWSSATAPSAADRHAPEEATHAFSAQSLQVIAALEEGLADPDCTQLDGYGPGKISAQFKGEHTILDGLAFSSVDDYLAWMKQMVDAAYEAGAVTSWQDILDQRRGVLNLAGGGRFTVILPPIAKHNHPTFSLRKHVAAKWQPASFVENETMTQPMMDFLRAAVAARVNILFVGQMGSGKTTLLRTLAQGFGENEKVAVVEQVPELAISKPLTVSYVYQPNAEGMTLHDVLDDQLYNGVERLIVGEVHLEGITKMLETMIVTEGSMSTYHAFSTEQAGERMKLALQIENQNVTAQTALSFIKQGIELVVVLEKVNGKRRCTQITELDWRSSGGKDVLGGRDLFVYDRSLNGGAGGFKPTGNAPDPSGRVRFKQLKYGVPMNENWFIDQAELARLQAIAREG